MKRDWSRTEVEAAVSDYFEMLTCELREEPYNKAEHRRALMPQLEDRTGPSVEFKHRNISAAMTLEGYPCIRGYLPAYNAQSLVFDVVAERVAGEVALKRAVEASVVSPATVPAVSDFLVRLELPPASADDQNAWVARESREVSTVGRVDYLERESRNASLGDAGELFVLGFEKARLASIGALDLAGDVEHVAKTQGDGLGYDIRSFDDRGRERLIEVKTTAYGKETPFFMSRNELEVSRLKANSYAVYRVFGFRADPRLFMLPGSVDDSCRLEAVQFSARVR